ncbi:MAG: hypothetical protein Q9M14_06010 [Mariprofundaceae bacterium]|nr:hypothetical protein [Mariprofundaceae bacterium]
MLTLKLMKSLHYDSYADNRTTGSFIMIDTFCLPSIAAKPSRFLGDTERQHPYPPRNSGESNGHELKIYDYCLIRVHSCNSWLRFS